MSRARRWSLVFAITAAGCSGGGKKGGNPVDAAVIVSPAGGPTSESGGQASFTVVLTAKPKADVIVTIASGDESEGTVGATSLTFTKDNFDAPQTVLVTGQDDEVADGSITYPVILSMGVTEDSRYEEIDPVDAIVVNVDDETAGVTVSPISGATSESGAVASFTVVLNSQPLADVVVGLESSDSTEGTASTQELTFTPTNWNAPRTVDVTGVGDEQADGDQIYEIVFGGITSQDSAYAALTPASVPVTNIDDDSAAILVSPVSGGTSESGAQATFSIVLTSQPSTDVTVSFGTNDAGEGNPNGTGRSFSPTNYTTPQTVTVTGVDDGLADGNQSYAIVFSGAVSGDPDYAGLTPPNVAITNFDNDSAGIDVSSISGATSESGGTATFSIALRSQPMSSVTVNLGSNDSSEGFTDLGSLIFTTSNYATPQSVTVTGVDDLMLDGNQSYQIVFGPTSSGDGQYAAITPANIPVTNADDDVPRKVLIVHASDDAGHVADVDAKLEATGAFEAVDAFDGGAATPTLAELGAYRAVLVMNDTASWSDAAAVGDVLADYFDAGNQVVLANFTHSAGIGGSPIGGRFATTGSNGYMILDTSGSVVSTAASLGTIASPGHVLLREVTMLSATSAYRNSAAPLPDVTVIASWNDGTPLVVTRTLPNGRIRTDLNMSGPSGDALSGSWTGDGAELIRNALLYVNAGGALPPPPPASCDPATEVESGGRCYYLDGSGGTCLPGYELVSESILNTIQPLFFGKTYRTQVSGNCCIYNADPVQNWGMKAHCNVAGTFNSDEPALGGANCTNISPPLLGPTQLTLCGSL